MWKPEKGKKENYKELSVLTSMKGEIMQMAFGPSNNLKFMWIGG